MTYLYTGALPENLELVAIPIETGFGGVLDQAEPNTATALEVTSPFTLAASKNLTANLDRASPIQRRAQIFSQTAFRKAEIRHIRSEAEINFGRSIVDAVLPNKTVAETKDDIQKKYGEPLTRENCPGLYGELDPIMQRLAEAFNTLNTTNVQARYEIAILNSNEENAFVYGLVAENDQQRTNLVYVTTGLLRALMRDQAKKITAESIRQGFDLLAGILAHEMAHPLDYLDPKGLGERWGAIISDQARELRADIEAVLLLREARLATDALLRAFDIILHKKEKSRSAAAKIINAGISTHPEDDLRRATLALFLTLDEFEKGESCVEAIDMATTDVIASELRRLPRKEKISEPTLPKPTSLRETLELLIAIRNAKGQYDNHQIKVFSHLLVTLDRYLIDAGEDLNEEEYAKLLEFNQALALDPKSFPYAKTFSNDHSYSHDRSKRRSHYHSYFLDRIPVYRTERYQKWLRQQFKQALTDENLFDLVKNLYRIAPADIVLEIATKELKKAMLEWFQKGYQEFFHRHNYNFDDKDARVAQTAWLHKNILPELDLAMQVAVFFEDYDGIFPQYWTSNNERRDPLNGGKVTPNNQFIIDILQNPHNESLRKSYEALAQQMWENRGEYGVLEFMTGDWTRDPKSINWELVFHLLHIDKRTGYRKIEEAVQVYTQSEQYVALLSVLSAHEKKEHRTSTSYDPLHIATCRFYDSPKPWVSRDLYPYLSGTHNPHLAARRDLQDLAKGVVAGSFLMSDRERFIPYYKTALADQLTAVGWSCGAKDFVNLHERAVRSLTRDKFGGDTFNGPVGQHWEDVWAEVLAEAPIDRAEKIALLGRIFITDYDDIRRSWFQSSVRDGSAPVASWVLEEEHQISQKVYDVLVAEGVVKNATDLFLQLRAHYQTTPERLKAFDTGFPFKEPERIEKMQSVVNGTYSHNIDVFIDKLLSDLEAVAELASPQERGAQLLSFLDVVDPFPWNYHLKTSHHGKHSIFNMQAMRRLKQRICKIADGLPLSMATQETIFNRLTVTGATRDTDLFFRQHLKRSLMEATTNDGREKIGTLLKKKQVESRTLQVELARFALEPELERASQSPMALADVETLLKKINELIPDASQSKDQFLEDIAWRLNLNGERLALVEEAKGTNWRKNNPIMVNFLSSGSQWCDHATETERLAAIQYIADPQGRDLPSPISDAMDRSVSKLKGLQGEVFVAKHKLTALVNDLSPLERIPVLHLLLNKGEPSLMEDADYPYNISRDLLGYQPGSQEERLLVAGLNSIPEAKAYQRPVVLAYLLAISNQEKSGIKAIFEAFTTVGIKLGQIASIFWKENGVSESTIAELKQLKDHARPLTLAEVYRIMDATLTDEERGSIARPVQILGSASLRTAVLIELVDGQQVVMLLQRPYAEEQIDSNLTKIARLIPELRAQGFTDQVDVVEAFLRPVGEQLHNALRMSQEAACLEEARAFYRDMNEELQPYLGEWRFVVPELVPGFQIRDTILFTTYVGAGSFDALPAGAEKQRVGISIDMAALKSLFERGFMNTDPHQGNYLVDASSRTIGVIDWGQNEHFYSAPGTVLDDRYYLTQFLWGIFTQDIERVVHYGQRLRDESAEAVFGAHVREKLKGALTSDKSFASRLTATLNAFAGSDAQLSRRFSAGAILGLMILGGENFTDPATFQNLLMLAGANIIIEKTPDSTESAAANSVQQFVNSALQAFRI